MEETRQLFSVWVRSGMSLGPLNFEVPVVTEAPSLGGSSIPLMLALAPWHQFQGPLLHLPWTE